ncbi:histone lysine demethylase JMJD6b [Toxoplasma gondii RUB]|uniref:Histone lysine demethylase JMJD6b n=1 Tax=Toxoplasma gondii RUB TaxID=935652 RepID=A0A086M3E2_TOXGO|nr:histone lysine demethylase JMJD6b [Toxoplasma gondii RUB]
MEVDERQQTRVAFDPGRKKNLKKKKPRLLLTKHPFGLLPSGNALFVSSGGSTVVDRSASLGSFAALDDAAFLAFLSTLAEFVPLSALLSLSCASKFLLAALLDEELWQSLLLSRQQRRVGREESGARGLGAREHGEQGTRKNGETLLGTADPLLLSDSASPSAPSPPSLSSSFSACSEEAETPTKDETSESTDFTWRGSWKKTYLFAERERLTHQRTARASSSSSSSACSTQEERSADTCLDTAGDSVDRQSLPVLRGVCSDTFYQRWLCATVDISSLFFRHYDNLERVSASALSVDAFVELYEKPNKPVVITDLVPKWAAFGKWNGEYFRRHFGGVRFNAGAASNIQLETFYQYADSNFDEAPLFIFDPRFAESTREALSSSSPLSSSSSSSPVNVPPASREIGEQGDCRRETTGAQASAEERRRHELGDRVCSLAEDYEVPPYFSDSRDLFACLGERRPNFRWLLVGNCRSGSKWHVDPNQTSAWNAVVRGAKRWILLPPTVCPPGVFPSHDGGEVTQPTALVEWLMNYYFDALHAPGYPYTGGIAPLEGSVREGELIFVPQGWWHCVLNEEDDTIAVTQNFVSPVILQNVRSFLHYKKDQISGLCAQGRHETFASEFDAAVGASYPELLPLVSSPPPPCPSSSPSSPSPVSRTALRSSRPKETCGEEQKGVERRGGQGGEPQDIREQTDGEGREGTKRNQEPQDSGSFWERLKKRRRPVVLRRHADGETPTSQAVA